MGGSQLPLEIGHDFDFVVHHDCAGELGFGILPEPRRVLSVFVKS